MKILISYLSFLVLPLMCSQGGSEDYATETMAVEAVEAAYEEMPQQKNSDFIANDENQNEANTKIIKTANLRFATANIDESYALVQKSAQKYKAILQNDNTGKDYYSVYRNVTLRIPKQHFDAFINDLSKGVAYFDRKEISAQDVTDQYIDIKARIKAKKTLENRYLELLAKANKVSEILEIEKELATIREEIEAKEGQLNYLQSQVSMSTVTIEMYVENASGNNVTVSYGRKMGNAIKSGFNGLSTFFLGILYIWPFILILAIVFFIVRYIIRKKQK